MFSRGINAKVSATCKFLNRNGESWVWDSGRPLAALVEAAAEHATYRDLAERGVDPKTGYRVPYAVLWRIGKGEGVKINPPLVRAVAAAIGRPAREVQLAAAQQYVGLVADDPFGATTDEMQVVVAHVPGMTAADMPLAGEVLRKWAVERGTRVEYAKTEGDSPE